MPCKKNSIEEISKGSRQYQSIHEKTAPELQKKTRCTHLRIKIYIFQSCVFPLVGNCAGTGQKRKGAPYV